MARKYEINITNGSGSEAIMNGSYSASATSIGYDSTTINPSSITVDDEHDTYAFTIGATGTLTLHISEDGSASGTPIVGAEFYRCNSDGSVTYGNSITSGNDGNVVFNNVPYSETDTAPTIYVKQTKSDGSHYFDTKVYNYVLDASTSVEEIINTPAATKTITLKDANYDGLEIATAQVVLDEQA